MAKRFRKLMAVLLGASLLAGSMPVMAYADGGAAQAAESVAAEQGTDETGGFVDEILAAAAEEGLEAAGEVQPEAGEEKIEGARSDEEAAAEEAFAGVEETVKEEAAAEEAAVEAFAGEETAEAADEEAFAGEETAEEPAAETFAGEEETDEEPTITLDGNGGNLDGGSNSITVTLYFYYDTLEDILDDKGDFRWDGYKLKGWAEEPDSTEPKQAEDIRLSKTATYYAIWEAMPAISLNEKVTVNYDQEGPNFWYVFTPEEDGWYLFDFEVTGEKISYLSLYEGTYYDNEIFSVYDWENSPIKKLEGGKVYGAYFSLGDGTAELTVTKSTTFVSFEGNGGALESGETAVEVAVAEDEWLSNVLWQRVGSFKREGYVQTGWSTLPDGSDVQPEYAIIAESGKTYYAVWGKIVTMTFNGNGAKIYDDDKTAFTIEDAVEGRSLTWYDTYYSWKFKEPAGKVFSGWALTADATEKAGDVPVTDGMTVYAVWKTAFYQVDLYANGGYFSTEKEISFAAGGYADQKLSILPSDTPTCLTKGKVFDGWYWDADCKNPIGVSLSEFKPTGYTMLYAGYKDDGSMVSKITLNKTAKVLLGKTKTLKATVAPTTAKNKTLTWTSSNKKIATVTSKGVVKGIAKGTVTITAKAKDGSGVKAVCKLTVCQPVTKITLSKTQLAVLKGKTKTLTATATPKTAALRTVTWSSSNKKVATVNAKGVVKGVGVGTATITAKAKDGSGVKATCKVVVRQPVTKITISKTEVTLKKGKSTTLKAVVKPNSAYNKAVTWSSSNKKVATVTQKGVVKAIAKGTATITVKAKDGSGKTVTCKVTVK